MGNVSVKFDTSEWDSLFARLETTVKESLARRMLVAGGVVMRDEAKRWVPIEVGRLLNSIYLAFDRRNSSGTYFQYNISWNAKEAPHGHLIEFGHWMPWQVVYLGNGVFKTLAQGKGGNAKGVPHPAGGKGKWIPGKPFLRPAYDVSLPRAKNAMIETGRREVQILLNGGDTSNES